MRVLERKLCLKAEYRRLIPLDENTIPRNLHTPKKTKNISRATFQNPLPSKMSYPGNVSFEKYTCCCENDMGERLVFSAGLVKSGKGALHFIADML